MLVDEKDAGSPRGSADLRYQEGVELDANGDPAGAISALEAATRLEPGHVDAWRVLGFVHLQVGNANAAIVAFGSSLKARRENPEAYIGMGFALARQGDEEGAESCFKNAYMQTLFDTTPWVEAGKYLFSHGYPIEANFCFQSALQIDPEDPDALDGIRGLLASTGAKFVARDELGEPEPIKGKGKADEGGDLDDEEDDEENDDEDLDEAEEAEVEDDDGVDEDEEDDDDDDDDADVDDDAEDKPDDDGG